MQAAWIVDPGESVLSIGILARQALPAAEKREREREREREDRQERGRFEHPLCP